MTKLEVTRTIIKTVVGLSTGFCVSTVVKNNVGAENVLQKTERFIGATVIAMMVSNQAEAMIDSRIDKIVEAKNLIKE